MSRAPVTPPSLKWLLDRRARIAGEIAKAHKRFALQRTELADELSRQRSAVAQIERCLSERLDNYERIVSSYEKTLAAIDLVIQQHEVPVDISAIRSVQEHENPAVGSYGQVTRLIMQCLREAAGAPRTTTEVVCYLAARMHNNPALDDFPRFRYQVRCRMSHLAWEGRLERLHAPKTSLEGRWRLPASVLTPQAPHTLQDDGGPANNRATTETGHSKKSV